jgi:hypothetical protein
MKRMLRIGAALLVASVVVGGFLLYSSLDAIVKAAIEKIGSDVTGTEVRVTDVDISPATGEGALRGFRVTNPEGFEDEQAFEFDEITMKIDLATLASDPVVIEEIVVQSPRIRYELGGKGTNVGAIQKNVEGYTEGSEPAGGPSFIIKHLYFRDGQINVAGASLLKKGVGSPLPDLHMTDIGTEEGGVTPAVLTKKVTAALGRKVVTAVGKIDLGELESDTKEAAKKTGQKIKGLFKKDD